MVFDMRMALEIGPQPLPKEGERMEHPGYVSPVRIRSGGQTSKFNTAKEVGWKSASQVVP
jgi:hypothetical protein